MIWTETFFHVLAHVDVGAVPASCHSPAYVAWAEERLGPASARSLGEDARTLASAAPAHDALARLQGLAFLFRDEADARAASDRDLAELTASDVADADALRAAVAAGAAAEVLRAATELELANVRALPPPELDREAMAHALERMSAIVPELARFEVRTVRALGIRGRAYPRTILVGTPGIAGADVDHVAWQAAHEAIVASQPRGQSFVAVERAAISVLRARAKKAGLGDDHARWLARFDVSALGPIPHVADGA